MNVAPFVFGTLAGFVLAIGATGGLTQPAAEPAVQESTTAVACAWEDSPGPCFWDAQNTGNGLGTSFVRNADDSITYLPEPTPEQEYVAAIRSYEEIERGFGVDVGYDTDEEVVVWGNSQCEAANPNLVNALLAAQFLCPDRLPEFTAKAAQLS